MARPLSGGVGETNIADVAISPDWPLCLIGKKHDKENAFGYGLKLSVNAQIGKTSGIAVSGFNS